MCIEFLPELTVSAPIPGSATPNMEEVNPSGTTWRIEFDRVIERPLITAYITFHDAASEVIVYSIDISSSSVKNGTKIAFTPSYTFELNNAYYINIDRVGVEMCGLHG